MTGMAVVAFATLFAAVGPLDVAAVFAAMSAGASPEQRRAMARRGTGIAAAILVLFALVGGRVLESLGISLPAFRIAGGILLLLIGVDLVFGGSSTGVTTTREEASEGAAKSDVSVFPLATPLIAGPGAMTAAVLLMAEAGGDWILRGVVLAVLLLVLAITWVALLAASKLDRLLGVSGMHVVGRVFGVLLTALAVQFVLDGVVQSGLLAAR